MRSAVAKKIRRAQDQTFQHLIDETAGAYARAFASAPMWRRLWWALRGRIV